MKPRLSQIRPEGSAGTYPKVNATQDGWDYDTPSGGSSLTYGDDVLVASGGETSITFDSTLVAKSVILSKNGVMLAPTIAYTKSGVVANLGTVLNANDVVATSWAATSATPAAPTLSSSTTAHDTYTRTSSISLGTADSGQAWAALKGTWGTDGTRAKLTAAGGGQEFAAIDAGASEVNLQASLTLHQGSGPQLLDAGLNTKIADVNNHLYVAAGASTSKVTIYKKVAGSFTQLAQGSKTFGSAGTVYVMSIVNSPATIAILINDLLVVRYTLTSGEQAAFNGNTKHGINANSGSEGVGGTLFDDFWIH